jgi:hypothetical protein
MQKQAREGATLFEKIMQTKICKMFELFELSRSTLWAAAYSVLDLATKSPNAWAQKAIN